HRRHRRGAARRRPRAPGRAAPLGEDGPLLPAAAGHADAAPARGGVLADRRAGAGRGAAAGGPLNETQAPSSGMIGHQPSDLARVVPRGEHMRRVFLPAAALLGLAAVLGQLGGAFRADTKASVKPFTLQDPAGKEHSWKDLAAGKKAVVAVFLGTECPVNNAYLRPL